MTGEELEKTLSRYRIAGPPPRLRARILAAATPDSGKARPVWAAIWALAACTVLLVGGASGVYGTLGRETADAEDRRQQVASTAEGLGGGALGLEQASAAVMAAESDMVSVQMTAGAGGQR